MITDPSFSLHPHGLLVVAERPTSPAGVANKRKVISLRNVTERLGLCFVGPGFSYRLQNLLDRGLEEEKKLFGHGPTVHLHCEFTAVPVHYFHFDSRFFPQCVRHTGGMFSGTDSDRAFSNGYLFHSGSSFGLIGLHPLGTNSLSRVSRRPTLVVMLIRALLLGAVKTPATVWRTSVRHADARSGRWTDARNTPTLGPHVSDEPLLGVDSDGPRLLRQRGGGEDRSCRHHPVFCSATARPTASMPLWYALCADPGCLLT